MDIEKTTAAERLTICQAVDHTFVYVMRAQRLIMNVLDDFFDDTEQRPISPLDAESIADMLCAANDALWWAETEYSLTVGNESAPGCKVYYDGAKRALLVRDVERLRSKLKWEDAKPYTEMADEDALPILQEIAKKKGVNKV